MIALWFSCLRQEQKPSRATIDLCRTTFFPESIFTTRPNTPPGGYLSPCCLDANDCMSGFEIGLSDSPLQRHRLERLETGQRSFKQAVEELQSLASGLKSQITARTQHRKQEQRVLLVWQESSVRRLDLDSRLQLGKDDMKAFLDGST